MKIPLSLAKPARLPYLDAFVISKTVRALDAATGRPELRYARNRSGERVLCMRWSHGAAAHEDLKVFWWEEVRTLRQLTHADGHGLFARIEAARADSDGFHLVLARNGRYVLAELLDRAPWPCESPSDRAHTWRNLARLGLALSALHDRGIVHRNMSRWSVLASTDRTNHFQLIGHEWSMRASIDFEQFEQQDVIRQNLLGDWRGFADLARSLLTGEARSSELTREELTLLHDLEHSAYLDGSRVCRRALAIAATLESAASMSSAGPRPSSTEERQTLALQGLLLAQVLQMLIRAANEFPVEVVNAALTHSSSGVRRWRLRLQPRPNAQYSALCRALDIHDALARRLHDALMDPPSALSESWYWVSDDDDEGGEAGLSFVRAQEAAQRYYVFDSDSQLLPRARGMLVNSQGGRSDQQFRRQLRAWRALRRQPTLLANLLQPSSLRTAVATVPLDDDRYGKLDADKQRALRKALAAEHIAVTQGPPGVGKTTLVAELVRQVGWTEPDSKLLFSAQSHAAVDHLLSAVRGTAPTSAFIVRCHAPEAKRVSTPEDLSRQAAATLTALNNSVGLARASAPLREVVRSLIEGNTRSTQASAARFHRRPLDAHLLRAATLVFGTSNCASFEHLFNERAQFDLSVIEEAAKATGNDLLNAVLLAPRQLMIGDHRQLPPFESEKLEKLLASPARVTQLLSNLPDSVAKLFEREMELQDMQRLFDRPRAKSSQAEECCQSALRMLFLFKTLVTAPEAMSEAGYGSALTVQHRMHPAIARVVSHAFYDGALQSDPTCVGRFARETPPVRFNRDETPEVPILWIDTPWVQREFGSGHGEQKPGPVNPNEVHAVVQVVQTLEPHRRDGKRPSLAILTPYRKQLERLKTSLWRSAASANLERFASIGGTHFHTVDSFQGNEADVVIVSLVRNNAHHSLSRALGFLQDERRMTVLMSRAKWRLIVIGSLDFLRATIDRHMEQPTVAFLTRLLEAIDEARQHSTAAIMRPYHEQRGPRNRR